MTELITINNIFKKSMDILHMPAKLIRSTINKDSSISIKLLTSPTNQSKESYTLLAKLVLKTKKYFLIDTNFINNYEKVNSFHTESISSELDNTRILISNLDDEFVQTLLAEMFSELILNTINNSISDFFGCCSRYIDCSNAKQCIHPDVIYSFSCLYKHNLDIGKIFYGINKNV